MSSRTAITITLADAVLAQSAHPALVALLRDAVDQGASVGFLAPLAQEPASRYWQGVQTQVAKVDKLLWLAHDQGTLVGTVQLEPCGRENGRHRAEVQKLLVLSSARRRGVAAQLMQALQAHGRTIGLRTLHLDTEQGSPAEGFYQSLGYVKVGVIPDYCLSSSGASNGTAIYYRQLVPMAEKEAA